MWVLLLRAVNVGGRNRLPMADLTEVLTSLGHTQVSTLLASGNAVFASPRRDAAALAREIESALREQLDLELRVAVRRPTDLQVALRDLPDLPGYALIAFLLGEPEPAALQAFLDTDWSPDVAQAGTGVLYLGYPDGAGRSRLSTARIERALGVACTARTPDTVRALLQRAESG